MRPDRFFVNDANREAYELGYADGLKDGQLKIMLDERAIRDSVKDELKDAFNKLKDERRQLHVERKQRAQEKRRLVAFRKFLQKQNMEVTRG